MLELKQLAYRSLDNLPQALLIQTMSSDAVLNALHVLAKRILCAHQTACGRCHACHLFEHHHPDFHLLLPEGASRTIKVDLIRDLNEKIRQAPQIGTRRVVLIQEAERMNPAAQNALLKTLEEPPASATFILITRFASLLLPTIRSRCVMNKFDTYEENLDNAHEMGRIQEELIALRRGQLDPLAVSGRWLKLSAESIYTILQRILLQFLKQLLTEKHNPEDNDLPQPAGVFLLYDLVMEQFRELQLKLNLNQGLCFDVLLTRWISL